MSEKQPVTLVDTDATQLNQVAMPLNATEITPPPDFVDFQPLAVGGEIKATFKLVEVLGDGGMGTVFKALNKVWEEVEARDPYVAIKVLKPELSNNKQLVRSLYSDFDRTKMLANCPNIIKVYGFDRDGVHVYITMEYLDGQTLGDYLKQQPLTLQQAWFIIEGIGNALAYAHQNNIVHRDVKPGNVMITSQQQVKVLDFGIASKINESEGDETKFSGHQLGAFTPAYASPEMQRGFPPDARDDVYAFGCVIYEILTGQQFFKQRLQKAEPIPGLSKRQMRGLNQALAVDREQRIPTIQTLLNQLKPTKNAWKKQLSFAIFAVFLGGLIGFFLMDESIKVLEQELYIEDSYYEVYGETIEIEVLIAALSSIEEQELHIEDSYYKVYGEIIEIEILIAALLSTEESELHIANRNYDDFVFYDIFPYLIKNLNTKTPIKKGKPFTATFTLTKPCYIRLIDYDAKGNIALLYPNPYQKDKLLSNKTHHYPAQGMLVSMEVAGNSKLTLIASEKPFPKKIELLDKQGEVSKQIDPFLYDWKQISYVVK